MVSTIVSRAFLGLLVTAREEEKVQKLQTLDPAHVHHSRTNSQLHCEPGSFWDEDDGMAYPMTTSRGGPSPVGGKAVSEESHGGM